MRITGTDEVSLKKLAELEQGIKIKDIPSKYSVSLDQAKRLSRYHQVLMETEVHLAPILQKIFEMLGLRAIFLSLLFKIKDREGLTDVLQSVDEKTRRDDFPAFI